MNVICVNCKEVYAIRPDQCGHCGRKTFSETHAAVRPKDIGTITWFKCETITPVINDLGFSDQILLFQQATKYISKGKYYQADVRRFIPNVANWVPTHWAYINYPEPSQD